MRSIKIVTIFRKNHRRSRISNLFRDYMLFGKRFAYNIHPFSRFAINLRHVPHDNNGDNPKIMDITYLMSRLEVPLRRGIQSEIYFYQIFGPICIRNLDLGSLTYTIGDYLPFGDGWKKNYHNSQGGV